MKYPKQAKELLQLLQADQKQKRDVGRTFFHEGDRTILEAKITELRLQTGQRTKRMLKLLDEIGEPSISNIGAEGAQAVSVLALHDSLEVLRRVLKAFMDLYDKNRDDTYYQVIPSMTDRLLILERKPQLFGTQWMTDENKEPFLPPVENFEHVNDRRAEYDIEPFRWPRSLAIAESEQPWLRRPLTELVMREPTDEELNEFGH